MNPGRTILTLLFGLMLFILTADLLAADKAVADNYKLGTGDNIRIQVFQEGDLTLETRISDTGTSFAAILRAFAVS